MKLLQINAEVKLNNNFWAIAKNNNLNNYIDEVYKIDSINVYLKENDTEPNINVICKLNKPFKKHDTNTLISAEFLTIT